MILKLRLGRVYAGMLTYYIQTFFEGAFCVLSRILISDFLLLLLRRSNCRLHNQNSDVCIAQN